MSILQTKKEGDDNLTDARISKIKNGFTVYDDCSCEEVYCKTLDEALKRAKKVFEEITAYEEMESAET